MKIRRLGARSSWSSNLGFTPFGHLGAVLLRHVRFFTRDEVADEEALDPADPEGKPPVPRCLSHFLDGSSL